MENTERTHTWKSIWMHTRLHHEFGYIDAHTSENTDRIRCRRHRQRRRCRRRRLQQRPHTISPSIQVQTHQKSVDAWRSKRNGNARSKGKKRGKKAHEAPDPHKTVRYKQKKKNTWEYTPSRFQWDLFSSPLIIRRLFSSFTLHFNLALVPIIFFLLLSWFVSPFACCLHICSPHLLSFSLSYILYSANCKHSTTQHINCIKTKEKINYIRIRLIHKFDVLTLFILILMPFFSLANSLLLFLHLTSSQMKQWYLKAERERKRIKKKQNKMEALKLMSQWFGKCK